MMILPVENTEHVTSFMSCAGLNLIFTALYREGSNSVLNTGDCEKCSDTRIKLRLQLREKFELIIAIRKFSKGRSDFNKFLTIHRIPLTILQQSNKFRAPAICTAPFGNILMLFLLTSV